MINELSIRNFKCFRDIKLPLRALTVLSGMNGAGKSTVIQALLLLRQAAGGAPFAELNGSQGLNLGEASEVLFSGAETQSIELAVVAGAAKFECEFHVPIEERLLHLRVIRTDGVPPPELTETRLQYIAAERLGPRDLLSVTSADISTMGVGIQGEFTAQVLAIRERDVVPESLRQPDMPSSHTVRAHAEAWLANIVSPLHLEAQWPPGLTASTIRYQTADGSVGGLRPTNVGFGVSYALPIIVAGLTIDDGCLVVENPEAHLHPASQSRLGYFLGKVSRAGAQVIVETHSDHIVNGIRVAVAQHAGPDAEGVVFNFFGPSSVDSIDVSSRGGLSSWPRGFFDQIELDLGALAREKRRGAG